MVDLIDPRFAADVWRDIDQNEIRALLGGTFTDVPWKSLENFPQTQSLLAFHREVDNVKYYFLLEPYSILTVEQNMYKCWERYGKKALKPKMVEQDLRLFINARNVIETKNDKEHIMVVIPFIKISQLDGLPALMEGSHREKNKGAPNKPYFPTVKPGQALMFDARLTSRIPKPGGGVVLARIYDVTGM